MFKSALTLPKRTSKASEILNLSQQICRPRQIVMYHLLAQHVCMPQGTQATGR